MGRSIGVLAIAFAAACTAADDGDEDEYGEPPDDFELDGVLPVVLCEGDSEAHANLNAFWFAFESEYGLFDMRLPDDNWHALGLEACAQIGDDEGVGVPVDVPIAFDSDAFAAGTDVMLDAAIAALSQ
jgi:hypothetical protein